MSHLPRQGHHWGAAPALALLIAAASIAPSALAATLGLSKTPSVTEVESGVEFTYTLDYTCVSQTENCRDVVLTDTLPAELDPKNVTLVGSAHTVSESYANGVVTFDFGPELAAGSPGQVLVIVRFPNGTTPDGATATNTAAIVGSNADEVTATAATVTARASANWSIDKALKVSSPEPALDQDVLYTIAVKDNGGNTGALDLEGVTVTDILPAGAEVASISDGGIEQDGVITWNLGTLTGNKTLTVVLRYPSSSFQITDLVTNAVELLGTAIGGETILLEDQVQHGFDEATPAVGYFVKHGGGTAAAGDALPFRIKFRSTGNQPLERLTIDDAVPSGLEVISITTSRQDADSTGENQPCPVPGREDENGIAVAIEYMSRDLGTYAELPGSPFCTGSTSQEIAPASFLAGDDYITHLRWVYTDVPPGFFMTSSSVSPGMRVTIRELDAVTGAAILDGDILTNTATFVAEAAGSDDMTGSASRDINVIAMASRPRLDKSVLSGGTVSPGGQVSYRIQLLNQSNPGGPLTDFVVSDLLDANLEYVSDSWRWSETLPNVDVTFTKTENFRGTGRTLLRWSFQGTMGFWDRTRIDYDVRVKSGTLPGTVANVAALSSPPLEAINDTSCRQRLTDQHDFNSNGDTAEQLCASTASGGNISVVESASLSSEITVKGLLDAGFSKYPDNGRSAYGGNLMYKVAITNTGNVPMTDIVIVDVAPYVGDSGVIDLSDRGSQWRPFLIAPITPPAGVTILYSTSSNPCRGDMNPDNPDASNPWPLASDYPAGASNPRDCEAPNWSTVPPDDITTVQAYRFEFNDIVLAPRDSLEFSGYMQIPASAQGALEGALAWNSFAFAATRTDNGARLLPAEPLKVGVSLDLPQPAIYAGRVWLDDNENGIQDEPESAARNNVRVELYLDNGDGIADPATDTLVGFRLTADDADGNPGHFQFTDLPAGDYFARYVRPSGYTVVAPGAGGSSADTDSDADQATGLTPITRLEAGEIDDTNALGLRAATTATVGDYVWFDRNGDGLQNEPVLDGLNGVVVTLRTAGDPDTVIQSTTTADDVSGRPGYYQFDNLAADVEHLVQVALPSVGNNAFSPWNAGANDATDSDIDPQSGRSAAFQLTAGAFSSTLDVGIVLEQGTLTLADRIWHDTNRNGTFDANETGINGVRLNLYRDDGDGVFGAGDQYITATVTYTSGGGDGYYAFTDLPQGDYFVVVDPSSLGGDGPLADYVPNDNVIIEGYEHEVSASWLAAGWYYHFDLRQGGDVCSANHDADGIPLDLDPMVYAVETTFLDDIAVTLPEGQDIRVHAPELIAGEADPTIRLSADANLWVTFLHEGSAQRNVLGYYTYPADTPPERIDQVAHVVLFPNASFAWDGGNDRGLQSGHRVYLGQFPAGTAIGFFLAADGWITDGCGVRQDATGLYAQPGLNPEADEALRPHMVLVRDDDGGRLVLGIEESDRASESSDHDFNDLLISIEADPYAAIDTTGLGELKNANDADGDGVANAEDPAPNDPERAVEVAYPGGEDYATLAFEDNWPWAGDYDMNDLVLAFRVTETRDGIGRVKELLLEYRIRARSSLYSHEFGLFFHNLLPQDLESAEVWVTPGEVGIANAIAPFAIGPEPKVSNGLSLMLLDNNYDLQGNYHAVEQTKGVHLSTTGLVRNNTCKGKYFNSYADCAQQGPSFFARIVFVEPVDRALLGEPPYNPFIALDWPYGRVRETHLATMPPTNLINRHLFGHPSFDDDSDRGAFNPSVPHPQQGRFFLNAKNMPWAISIPNDWRPPMERVPIAPMTELYLDAPANTQRDPARDACEQPRPQGHTPTAAPGSAYPRFADCWIRSDKALDGDWYQHPVDGLVLPPGL